LQQPKNISFEKNGMMIPVGKYYYFVEKILEQNQKLKLELRPFTVNTRQVMGHFHTTVCLTVQDFLLVVMQCF
jgi:hypothetical protein